MVDDESEILNLLLKVATKYSLYPIALPSILSESSVFFQKILSLPHSLYPVYYLKILFFQ
ncbi:MAG: hypothetical protein DRI57_26120 [Deltaproteobacteria bacterium]|nr:MAG: hypothetical protein DRI57_26120 [Deltaproteobacteria bacterium]